MSARTLYLNHRGGYPKTALAWGYAIYTTPNQSNFSNPNRRDFPNRKKVQIRISFQIQIGVGFQVRNLPKGGKLFFWIKRGGGCIR